MRALGRPVLLTLGGLLGCAGAQARSDGSGAVTAVPAALSSASSGTASAFGFAGGASGSASSSFGVGGLGSNGAGSSGGGSGGTSSAPGEGRLGLNPLDFERPRKSPEVARENEQFRADFPELEPIRRLPDFLSVNAVVALMPDASDGELIREGLHRQVDGADERSVLGGYLDDEQRLFFIWLDTHVLTDVFAVYDSGRLVTKVVTSRARASLRDILPEADGARPELVLERITSTSVCCLPLSLEIYRVGKHGRVSQVFSHPRGHVDVGPGERYSFLNHFEFNDERLSVSSVTSKGAPTYDYVFDSRVGRYVPTAATAQKLNEAQRLRAARKLPGSKTDYDDGAEMNVDFP